MAPSPDALALIFDVDGVIIDSRELHHATWEEYVHRFGRRLPKDFQRKLFGKHNREIVRELFGPRLTLEEIDRHGAAKEALYRERARPLVKRLLVPGVEEFITRHAGLPKPDPEIYLLAAERLGVAPADCVIFEDSYSGVAAARAAGARVVGVQTTHAELPGVDLLIPDFRAPELEAWLGTQRSGYTGNRSL
jgi:HAD superfamily hydrolase (TIGR01509 family)